MADYRNYITSDPKILGGQPVIRGTRITVRTILASLADGDSLDVILAAYPTLTKEGLAAVIAFAAAAAKDDYPVVDLPAA